MDRDPGHARHPLGVEAVEVLGRVGQGLEAVAHARRHQHLRAQDERQGDHRAAGGRGRPGVDVGAEGLAGDHPDQLGHVLAVQPAQPRPGWSRSR